MTYLKSILVLVLIAVVAAAALTFAFNNTKPIIDRIRQERQDEALKKILPEADSFKEKTTDGETYFIASKNGQTIGRIFRQAQKGYAADPIVMLVGVSDGQVTRVEILDQRETPGLGDKVKEDYFRDQFIDKTADDPLVVKQDVDAITGATISSRAVANGVKESLELNKKLGGN